MSIDRTGRTIAAALLVVLLTSGCAKIALRMSSPILDNLSATIFEECDQDLAERAIPANLKILEGLLKNDPGNKKILTLLSMGYSGYGMLFLEDEAPERASRLYRRALNYGITALGETGKVLVFQGSREKDIKEALARIGSGDFTTLFWTTVSWNAWISLNLDKPAALTQLAPSRACLEKVLEMNPDFLHGFPYLLMGTSLAAAPESFGGNSKRAREYFEKALFVGGGNFFLTQYCYARYYATRVQNKGLFFKLIDEIEEGDTHLLRDVCLINTVVKKKAMRLQGMADELFY
ncbi:MAG: hypothetical protein JRH06_01005 [Deltaproteobacteria bacterium]|nr:hypothetical protein [Deltaproteobacteria bacterium]MBW2136117.1 hypothetical protein [Deltaproteobacteria bacterium]